MVRGDIALLYRRAGFGLRPDELDRAEAAGYEASVESLLSGLAAGGAVAAPPLQAPTDRAVPAGEVAELQQWWMDLMIAGTAPLREKLTLFWHGHFATAISKVRDPRLMLGQNQLFRRLGGGSFEMLVQSVAQDGAMMIWLDTSSDKKSHPNENFAREMMELFTLGIGNYTQGDVTAGARSFTGWVFDRRDARFAFRPAQHDFGAKTYLGQTGEWNGTDAVHIAVNRPESARFLLARLWSHFAYPIEPADRVIDDLLPAYGPSLSVTAALRAIFLHPEFLSPATRTGLVKQPVEYLAGAARALRLDATGLPAMSRALGQNLFDPPNVGGWGQNGYWLDTATALVRLRCALALARKGDLSALASLPPGQRVTAVAGLLGVDGWGPTTARALNQVAADPTRLAALALVSPEYVLA